MIADIIARLRSVAPALASVEGAEELAAITKGSAPRHAACFVLPWSDEAGPNERSTGRSLQRVETQFLTAFVVRRHDSAKGGRRIVAFDALKDAIEAALAGWAPNSDHEPVELVSGRSAPFGNGVTVYVQTWRTWRYLEEQP